MGTIADAAALPSPFDTTGQPFMNQLDNANLVADEAVQTIRDQGQLQVAQQPVFHEVSYKTNSDGSQDVSVRMPQSTLDRIMPLLQTGQATLNAFAQARSQIQAKRDFLNKNPLIGALGSIASTAAAGYQGGYGDRISPIVRAAGAFGLNYFGKTADQLSQEDASLAAQQFGISRGIISEQQQEEAIRQRERGLNIEEQSLGLRNRQEQDTRQQRARNAATSPYEVSANAGTRPSKEGFMNDPEIVRAFPDPKDREQKFKALDAQANAVTKTKAENRQAELEARMANERFQASLAAKERLNNREIALMGSTLTKLEGTRKDIADALSESAAARSFFETIAASQGLAPPATKAEAVKMIATAYNKMTAVPGNEEKAAQMVKQASGLYEKMDVAGKLELLNRQEKELYRTLPKEVQGRVIAPGESDPDVIAFVQARGTVPTAKQLSDFKEWKRQEESRIAHMRSDTNTEAAVNAQQRADALAAQQGAGATPPPTTQGYQGKISEASMAEKAQQGNLEYPKEYHAPSPNSPNTRNGVSRVDLVLGRYEPQLRPSEKAKVRDYIETALSHNPKMSDAELTFSVRELIKSLKEARTNETTIRSR